MDPLAWLGLRRGKARLEHLTAIHARIRTLLPTDEPVVLRYIVTVAVLLTRVAQADGRFLDCERDHLRALFQHIDRIAPEGVDGLCDVLNEHVALLSEEELDVCYREIKSLCDAGERMQLMRLLASQATADGIVEPSEHATLTEIAMALGISPEVIEPLEIAALSEVPSLAIEDGEIPSRNTEDPEHARDSAPA
ncbi:MAG: TerB family tellurite resistance protein [Myxococcales bacterium]|nr:TerB family tellurite resistance protein [Myxococcales bacterium]